MLSTRGQCTRTHGLLSSRRLSLYACVLLAFGLLLWARLILVTGTPRTAIAQPEAGVKTSAERPGVPGVLD